MPTFNSAIKTNKIPVVGLTPEQIAAAPSSPAYGQLFVDTTTTPKQTFSWDGAEWKPINIYAGTGAANYAAGNDSRITGAEQTANKGAASGYASLDGSTKVPIAQVPTGSTGSTVPFGNDARFTDDRTPLDNTVTAAKVHTTLKGGPAAGVESLRALGATSTTALAGNTRLDQIAAPTASVALGGQKITGLGAPTVGDDAARLSDVQAAAAGIDSKPSVRAATTVAGTLASSFENGDTVDGVVLATSDRLLIKNQADGTQNGIYVVAASGAPSRSSDTLTSNTFVFVEEGTTNADTQWIITNNGVIDIGTTVIVWAQFGAPGSVTGTTDRITVVGGVVDIAAGYVGQASITTLGTIATGVWNGTDIAVADGGTGSSTAAGARTNLGVAQKPYAANVAALTGGAALTVTHSLGTLDVVVQLYEIATGETAYFDVKRTTTNAVTVTSAISYAADLYRIVVVPAV